MKRTFLGAALSLASLSFAPSIALADSESPIITSMKEQGVNITHEFETPTNLKGYIGNVQGRSLTFYTTDDDKHVIIGTMMDTEGNNLSHQMVQEKIVGPKLKKAWPDVESSSWVQDGSVDSDVVLYTFTDPNCPYCALFREQLDPYIQSGQIQLRHIMVGVIAPNSSDISSFILQSENAADLLHKQQESIREGGIDYDPELAEQGKSLVKANDRLMGKAGFSGTPGTLFKDADGNIHAFRGLIDEDTINAIISGEL